MLKVLESYEIGSAIIGNLKQSKTKCVLVSGYIKPWGHLKEALGSAIKRGVDTAIYVREPEEKDSQKLKEIGQELQELNVALFTVQNLHAKIYLFDDKKVMVGSMNLYDYSQANSIDFQIEVDDSETISAVNKFINENVIPKAKLINRKTSFVKKLAGTVANKVVTTVLNSVFSQPAYCIRCRKEIPDDINKPLCDNCYGSWAKFKNQEFKEKYCLGCGKEYKTTYAKPYCPSCYKEWNR